MGLGSYIREIFTGGNNPTREKRAAVLMPDGSWADVVAVVSVDGAPDIANAPVTGFTAITTPGRGWGCNVTQAGWVLVTAVDDSQVSKYLTAPGNYEYPDSVKNVVPHPTKTAAVLDGVYGRK